MNKLKLILFLFFLAPLIGCATSPKSRDVQARGAWITDGAVAIGSISITALPDGAETLVARYREDTAWLSPSTKTHEIEVYLTGTNSTSQAKAIINSITSAFVSSSSSLSSSSKESTQD